MQVIKLHVGGLHALQVVLAKSVLQLNTRLHLVLRVCCTDCSGACLPLEGCAQHWRCMLCRGLLSGLEIAIQQPS